MARPIRKGKPKKRSYLGSGAGSMRSGTGATAKKPKSRVKTITNRLLKETIKSLKATDSAVAKSLTKISGFPELELKSYPFEEYYKSAQKQRRKKTTRTTRKRAKR